MKKTTFFALLLFGFAANSQITINNTQTPAQLVQNVLVGAGVTPTNIKFNGTAANAAIVRDQAARVNVNFNPGNLGFPSNSTGVILSTGKAIVALGPNDATSDSSPPAFPTAGDSDLALLSGQTVRNVSVLEFDFVATGLVLNFDFVFASEEYPEFVNSTFNDTFGFFLSGPGIAGPYVGGATNIALIPSTTTPITINTVNNGFNNDGTCDNCAYYYNNSNIGVNPAPGTGPTVQYDGFTTLLRATSPLQCGETYHIKLAVGNVSDNAYDSAVFLKNFQIEPLVLVDNYNLSDNPNVCFGETITIFSGLTVGTNVFEWTFNGVVIPGENGATLTVTEPGLYGLNVYTATMCQIAEDEILIDYLPEIPIAEPLDLNLCTSNPPPYTFNIDQTAYVLNTLDPNLYIVSYYSTSYNDAFTGGLSPGLIPNANLSSYVIPASPASIWIRVEDILTNCVVVREFVLDSGAPEGTIFYADSPYCNDITTPQPVTETTLTDGGTYSAVPNTLIIDPVTGEVTPFGSPIGVYTVTYEIPATAFCPVFQTTTPVEIIDCGSCTVVASSTSETICIGSAIPAMTYTVTGGATGAAITAGSLPGGVTGSLAGGVYTLSGTPSTVGVYNFTVSLNSGADVCTSNVTIDVKALPNAGTDGSTSVCENSAAAVNLFSLITGEQAGGTWIRSSGLGGTFDAAAGTFTPAVGASTSTFTYTLTGTAPCIDDTSIATVTINAQPTAGVDGNINICGTSATAIDLFSLITGEQSGGTWTRTGGSGGVFNAAAGTFTPSGVVVTSEFTYTVAGTAPCTGDSSIATVTISAQLDAGVDGSTSVCENSVAAVNLFSLITGEQTGGTWIRSSGLGGTFDAAAGTFTPAVGASTSTFTYTLTGTAPCIDDTSIATVTINAQPTAGVDGNINICGTSATAIDLFSLITGEQSGGTWTRTGGSGGVFNAAAGTFTPSGVVVTSEFTYTVAGTAPCTGDSSIATVTISAQLDAGTDGSTSVCENSAAAVNLFNLITGEQAGGTWIRSSGLGGTFDAAAGTFTPAVGATTSQFTYTLTGTAPCVDDSSIATVNIVGQPVAGTDGVTTVCESSTTAIDLFSLITGEQSGGTWTRTGGSGGVFNAGAGTFTPAVGAGASEFTYTLVGTAPCVNDTSLATVNINAQPVAGTDGLVTVCESSIAVINLFSLITGEQSGGTWTRTAGLGGTFNAAAGTFTPALGATTSEFTYTLIGTAPCVDDTSLATVNINAQPVAGTDGAVTVCESSLTAIDLFSVITGEQSGGAWTRTSGIGGTFDGAAGTFTPAVGASNSTFSYTLNGTAPCVNDVSIATININAQPVAGVDGNTAVCDSSTTAIDLFSLITGEQSGGTWTRATGAGGTFNAGAGTFTPAAGATTSTFTYTLIGTAPCLDRTSTATVNISAQPDAGLDGATAVCDTNGTAVNLFSLITGEQSGGTWVRSSGSGGTFNGAAGTYIPVRGALTSTFTYTIAGGPTCVDDSSIATINITAQPDAGTDGAVTVCDSSSASIDLFALIGAEQSGGAWTRISGSGGIFNAAAGTFTPSPGATSSTFGYTVAGVAPCTDDISIATVNINAQPDAGTSGITTVCDSSSAAISLSGLISGEQSGGIWTRTSGTGGTFNAGAGTFTPSPGATSSTFNYTLAGVFPCVSDASTVTVNINSQPNAGVDGAVSVCQTSVVAVDLFSLISGEQSGGAWTRTSGTGGTFNAGAGTFIPSGAVTSTFTYTIPGTAPCVDDASLATVNVNLQPDAGSDGSTTVCESSPGVINLFSLISGEQSGGIWTRTSGTGGTFNAGAGTFTPSPGATNSTFTYTMAATVPCVNDSSVATVNVTPQPDAGSDGSITVCESSPGAINLFGLISGEQSGGIWTRTSGAGGTFNAAAGTFTAAVGATNSTFTYTITGVAPCINDSSIVTVNVNPQPDAGTNGSTTVCATSTATISLSGLITGEQSGGIWTRTSGSGGTFNAGAGTFIPAIGATTSTFTYTIAAVSPCVNDASIATVNINAQPDAGGDGQVTVCSLSTTAIDLFGLISGEQSGGTWTRTSGSGGSFSAGAGTFVPGPVSSTFTYTIAGVAPCINDSSIATVNVTPAVVPTFAPVAAICFGEALNALATTSANGIPGTWSPALDNTATTTYTFTPSGSQCATTTTMTIIVNPLPVVSLPQDGYICLDNNGNPSTTFLLSTGLGAGYSFVWTQDGAPVGTNSGSYLATAPGSYAVEVTNIATGCKSSAQATVITSYPPQMVQAIASNYFSEQQIVTVSVFPAGNYEYQLDGGAFQDSNQFVNVATGDHTVHVRDKVGCGTAEDDFTIIDYPKFFTPNNDGYNDTWNIFALRGQANTKIYIFDRYGKLLKEISPNGTGWDGTFNQHQLPATDYWFIVHYDEENVSKVFKSHFALKR